MPSLYFLRHTTQESYSTMAVDCLGFVHEKGGSVKNAGLRSILDQALAQAKDEDYGETGRILAEKSRDLASSDTCLAEDLHFLSRFFGMYFDPSSPDTPYQPMWQEAGRRTTPPDDFGDEQLDLLESLLKGDDPLPAHVVARIADVLWIRRHRIEFAQTAVEHHLEFAESREDFKHWLTCGRHLERAFRLARPLRKGQIELFSKVVRQFRQVLKRGRKKDDAFLSCRLMHLLLDADQDHADTYLALAAEHAMRAEESGDFHRSKQYWTVHLQWARKQGRKQAIKRSQVRIAEGYATEARLEMEAGGSTMRTAMWLAKAVEAYRDIPSCSERHQELYQRLRQYQKQSLSEFERREIPVNISKEMSRMRELALATVRGKSLDECLLSLAFQVMSVPDFQQLQEEAHQLKKSSFWLQLVSLSTVDATGRIEARIPASFFASDENEREPALRNQIMLLTRLQHEADVQSIVEPIRQYIVAHHQVDESCLLQYCLHNSFVPSDQEKIYAKGLYHGLTGDFTISTFMLVPLIENAVRCILHEHGVKTSDFNSQHQIQEEWPLSRLLDLPETQEIFGVNQTLDLQALLVARSNGNLRNRVAHGLTNFDECNGTAAKYLWWTSLRFVLFEKAYVRFKHEPETETG